MSISSLTNTAASTAQRALNTNTTLLGKALTQLATGLENNKASDNPSDQAISAKLTATIKTIEQAARNTAQGASLVQLVAGAQSQVIDILTQAQLLAATASSDALSSSDRAKSDAAYQKLLAQIDDTANQTRWNGVTLLNGGAGSIAQPTVAVTASASVGGAAVTNAFNAGINVSGTIGFVGGSVQSCSVVTNGTFYDVSVSIGGQTFKATTSLPAANSVLTLTSVTDSRNRVAFQAAGSTAAITNAATFQSSLRALFGLDTGSIMAIQPATSTVAQNTACNIGAITSSSAAAPGLYALTYNSTTTTFTLTDGINVLNNVWNGTDTTVNFSNGVSIALNANPVTNPPNTPNNGQHVFSIVPGTNVSLNFQVGELATDILSISVPGINTATIGLAGTNVLTRGSAAATEAAISVALDAVTSQSAQMGAQQLQLELRQTLNDIAVENLGEALKTFRDTEMEKSMTQFTKYNVLTQVASAMLTQANQQMSQIITQLTRL